MSVHSGITSETPQAGGTASVLHQQLYTVRQNCHREEVCTPTVIQSGGTVTEVRYAHQQSYTARQNCNREEVCVPTVIWSGRAVTERRCVHQQLYSQAELSQRGVYAHQQLYTVRQSCHREEVCTPTVTHSQAELSQRGGVRTYNYTQVELSQRGGVSTYSYTQSGRAVTERRCGHQQLYTVRQSCHRKEVCAPTFKQNCKMVAIKMC